MPIKLAKAYIFQIINSRNVQTNHSPWRHAANARAAALHVEALCAHAATSTTADTTACSAPKSALCLARMWSSAAIAHPEPQVAVGGGGDSRANAAVAAGWGSCCGRRRAAGAPVLDGRRKRGFLQQCRGRRQAQQVRCILAILHLHCCERLPHMYVHAACEMDTWIHQTSVATATAPPQHSIPSAE